MPEWSQRWQPINPSNSSLSSSASWYITPQAPSEFQEHGDQVQYDFRAERSPRSHQKPKDILYRCAVVGPPRGMMILTWRVVSVPCRHHSLACPTASPFGSLAQRTIHSDLFANIHLIIQFHFRDIHISGEVTTLYNVFP